MVIESDVSRLKLSRVALEARQLARLRDAAGVTIACDEGSVWVTQDGESRDVVLSAGDCFRVEGRAALLLQAFEPSRVTIGEALRCGGGEAAVRPARTSAPAGRPLPA